MKKGDKIIWDSGHGYEIGYFISYEGVNPDTYSVNIITGICSGEVSHKSHQIIPYSEHEYKRVCNRYGYEKIW